MPRKPKMFDDVQKAKDAKGHGSESGHRSLGSMFGDPNHGLARPQLASPEKHEHAAKAAGDRYKEAARLNPQAAATIQHKHDMHWHRSQMHLQRAATVSHVDPKGQADRSWYEHHSREADKAADAYGRATRVTKAKDAKGHGSDAGGASAEAHRLSARARKLEHGSLVRPGSESRLSAAHRDAYRAHTKAAEALGAHPDAKDHWGLAGYHASRSGARLSPEQHAEARTRALTALKKAKDAKGHGSEAGHVPGSFADLAHRSQTAPMESERIATYNKANEIARNSSEKAFAVGNKTAHLHGVSQEYKIKHNAAYVQHTVAESQHRAIGNFREANTHADYARLHQQNAKRPMPITPQIKSAPKMFSDIQKHKDAKGHGSESHGGPGSLGELEHLSQAAHAKSLTSLGASHADHTKLHGAHDAAFKATSKFLGANANPGDRAYAQALNMHHSTQLARHGAAFNDPAYARGPGGQALRVAPPSRSHFAKGKDAKGPAASGNPHVTAQAAIDRAHEASDKASSADTHDRAALMHEEASRRLKEIDDPTTAKHHDKLAAHHKDAAKAASAEAERQAAMEEDQQQPQITKSDPESFARSVLALAASAVEDDASPEEVEKQLQGLLKGFTAPEDDQADDVVTILKVNDEKQMVWGWALVSVEKGQPVTDLQGDVIDTDDLAKAVHESFMPTRVGKRMHTQNRVVGEVVDSIVFTKDLQDALGIDLGREGWFVGMKIHKKDVWEEVKSGKLGAFSIGGEGERHPIIEKHKDSRGHGSDSRGARTASLPAGTRAVALSGGRVESGHVTYDHPQGSQLQDGGHTAHNIAPEHLEAHTDYKAAFDHGYAHAKAGGPVAHLEAHYANRPVLHAGAMKGFAGGSIRKHKDSRGHGSESGGARAHTEEEAQTASSQAARATQKAHQRRNGFQRTRSAGLMHSKAAHAHAAAAKAHQMTGNAGPEQQYHENMVAYHNTHSGAWSKASIGKSDNFGDEIMETPMMFEDVLKMKDAQGHGSDSKGAAKAATKEATQASIHANRANTYEAHMAAATKIRSAGALHEQLGNASQTRFHNSAAKYHEGEANKLAYAATGPKSLAGIKLSSHAAAVHTHLAAHGGTAEHGDVHAALDQHHGAAKVNAGLKELKAKGLAHGGHYTGHSDSYYTTSLAAKGHIG